MHQHQQSQVDHLLGLGYGAAAGTQIQAKPWLHDGGSGVGAGLLDGFYAPLLSGSIVPGLEELQVKAEAATGEHQQKSAAGGEQGWDLPTPSSSNVEASIIASDALMAAAASMNPAAVSTTSSTAPSAQSLLYWGNGGIGAAAAAWPDLANCGSSIATLF
uniref:Uncharacterized protein n=2 Tax=Oryza brachyantha TaxID=4533 RepID=J3ML78_ORYBR